MPSAASLFTVHLVLVERAAREPTTIMVGRVAAMRAEERAVHWASGARAVLKVAMVLAAVVVTVVVALEATA
jgi:hypothetical protein